MLVYLSVLQYMKYCSDHIGSIAAIPDLMAPSIAISLYKLLQSFLKYCGGFLLGPAATAMIGHCSAGRRAANLLQGMQGAIQSNTSNLDRTVQYMATMQRSALQ